MPSINFKDFLFGTIYASLSIIGRSNKQMILIKIKDFLVSHLSDLKIFRKVYGGCWTQYEAIYYEFEKPYPLAFETKWVPYETRWVSKARKLKSFTTKSFYIQVYNVLKTEEY